MISLLPVRDALGNPQTCLLIGGTSDIGRACLDELADGGRLRSVVLTGRNLDRLEAAAASIREDLDCEVHVIEHDVRDTNRAGPVVAQAAELLDDIDVAIVAAGVLGDQADFDEDRAAAIDAVTVNYVGPAALTMMVADRMTEQGHGALVVLSSVAALRPRKSLYVYASAKAGLDALAIGLGDSLAGSGVDVIVVRPGFVTTTMTEHLDAPPFSTDAATVGRAVAEAVRKRQLVVTVPATMKLVMTALRAVPRPIFRRLPI